MQKDKFLKKKQIIVQRSEFLQSQSQSITSYNPSDPYGLRMTHLWKQGDTIISVTIKRIIRNANFILNPDTYSYQNLKYIRNQLVKEKIKIIGSMIVILIPIAFIFPLLKPKFSRANRQYLLQFYRQSAQSLIYEDFFQNIQMQILLNHLLNLPTKQSKRKILKNEQMIFT